MPMNRYNSASALYSSNRSKMPNTDSVFDAGTGSSNLYRGSPDLGPGSGPASHRRYSSTDSMDGSSHYSGHSGGHSGGHSRQGSVSDEVSYPTRRLSTSLSRRQSTSADPLQFIKSKGAQDLAQIAQVQMKVAAESKKEATITRTRDDDIDWQANLSNWKNRRKSQSERSYQLKEELEQMAKEKEEGSSGPTLPAKTYSQMQEERERRKSTGRKFYPIEDEEEEEDIFHPTSVSRVESSLPSSNDRQSQGNESRDSQTKNQNDDNNNDSRDEITSSSRLSGNRSWRDTNKSASPEDVASSSSSLADRRASRSKLSEKLRSFDEDAEDSGWSSRSAASEQPSRHRRSGAPDFSNSSSRSNDNGVTPSFKDSYDSKSGPGQDSSSEEISESSRPDSLGAKQSGDNSSNAGARNYNLSATDNAGNVKLTTRNVGSRTQSKIGSIMRNFEEGDSKPAAPKQGYNERINLSARKSAFEVTTPREETTVVSKPGTATRAAPRPSYPVEDSPGEEESSSGSDDEDDASDGAAEDEKDGAIRNLSTDQAGAIRNLSTDQAQSAGPNNSSNNNAVGLSTSQSFKTTSTFAKKEQEAGKSFVEKTIKISQAKNSDRGFGFFLTGGADTDQPLAVSKVALGSSADVCDLRLKDQVLLVNQQDVTSMTATQVGDIVGRAVTSGNIELHIRREKGDDDFDDEEEDFSSSTEGEEDLASPGYKAQSGGGGGGGGETSVMDQLAAERQWLEQQIEQQTDQGERSNTHKEDNSALQVGEDEPDLDQTNHTVTLTLPQMGRQQNDHDPAETPRAGNKTEVTVLSGDISNWGDGPPAVLRKWQRQRQKEEYTFDSPERNDVTETFRKISLNTAMPKTEREPDLSANEDPPAGTAQAWDHRHDQWTRQQDAFRLHGTEEDASTAQAEFEANQAKMKTAYEDALKKAEDKEQERKKQEQEMLQPELSKAQLLEERKAERRARIFNTAAAAATRSPSPPPPPPPPPPEDEVQFGHRQHLYGNQFEEQLSPAAPDTSNLHSSSMVFHVQPLQLQQPQPQPQQQGHQHSQGFRLAPEPSQPQDGVFVIDPRNRQEQSDYSARPVAFHVNLGAPTRAAPESNTAALLEAERERIRLEELRKIEEERKRAKEEMRAKEEEEMKRIREKEEELQREKEILRLEREKFLREQEEFKRQQQQQQQHQQQQLQKQQQITNNTSQPMRSQPNNFNNSYSDNNSFTPRSNNTSSNNLPKWPPVNTNYSNNATDQKKSNNNSNYQNQQITRARGFSKEEMLSPSRPHSGQSATYKDRREWSSPSGDRYQHQQQQQRQQQSPPKQQQIHQKQQHLQSPQQYHHPRRTASPVGERGRSPQAIKKNSQFQGLTDHWLVEEAERRRLAETEGRLHSPNSQPSMSSSAKVGPIQPHAELPNRWRGGNAHASQQPSASMPAAIRQTLLLKTANSRGSNGPSDGDLAPPPPLHDPYHLSPSSNSSSRSPSRSPSGHRSVSPPGNRSPNYSHHSPSHHYQQERHSQQLQQQPQQPQQQQHYRQQIHHNFPQQAQAYRHHQSPSPYRAPQYYDQTGNSYNSDPPRHSIPPYKAPSPAPMVPPTGGENGLPVSGTQLCSYCGQELGFGPAMVIESLGLYFHVDCFRCCVCHVSLGTGAQGADVRVRANQLHCPDCYSNDEAGLKFSKV